MTSFLLTWGKDWGNSEISSTNVIYLAVWDFTFAARLRKQSFRGVGAETMQRGWRHVREIIAVSDRQSCAPSNSSQADRWTRILGTGPIHLLHFASQWLVDGEGRGKLVARIKNLAKRKATACAAGIESILSLSMRVAFLAHTVAPPARLRVQSLD